MTKLAESKVNTILIINDQRYNLKVVANRGRHPGQGPRDPAVPVLEIWDRDWDSFSKSGAGTGTQIQNLRDLGLGPGLKFEKSGTRNWDRDASKRDSGTRSRGLKIFRDTVPVPCRPLFMSPFTIRNRFD